MLGSEPQLPINHEITGETANSAVYRVAVLAPAVGQVYTVHFWLIVSTSTRFIRTPPHRKLRGLWNPFCLSTHCLGHCVASTSWLLWRTLLKSGCANGLQCTSFKWENQGKTHTRAVLWPSLGSSFAKCLGSDSSFKYTQHVPATVVSLESLCCPVKTPQLWGNHRLCFNPKILSGL
jgi:hypothetical protein